MKFLQRLSSSGELAGRRRHQHHEWFWTMIDSGLKEHFLGRSDVKQRLPEMEAAVSDAKLTPTEAALRLRSLLD